MNADELSRGQGQFMGQKRRRSSCPSVSGSGTQVLIARAPFTQTVFDELHLKKDLSPQASLAEKIKRNVYCSNRRGWKLLTTYIPVVKYIRYYKFRESALSDFMAGLTVGVIHIPQALAFGQLTSVKIQNGLFTSLWPVLIYVFFGTSAHVSMGTSAVMSILTAATVDREGQAWATNKQWIMNQTNNVTKLDDIPEYLDFKEEVAMGVALISGIMMMVMGLFKLGFITAYLSESFFTAFTSAAAVHIAVSQLPAMLGIDIDRSSGIFKVIVTVIDLCRGITEANLAAIVCSIVSCVVIYLVKTALMKDSNTNYFYPFLLIYWWLYLVQ